MDNEKVYQMLLDHLRTVGPTAVAYSGGVDSTFLLKAAKDALSNGVLAVTVDTPYMLKREVLEAGNIAISLHAKHRSIHIPFLEELKYNPPDRCYICKSYLMSRIKKEAARMGFESVLDGTTADDMKDYRPGFQALKEQQIRSPLLETNIDKETIRRLSKDLDLPTWNRATQACLLSRIPHDTEIHIHELERIEESEAYLLSLGFEQVRVRSHGDIARIEVAPAERPKFFDEDVMDRVSAALKSHGYRYVGIELEGYRTGSLNPKSTEY